MKYEKGKKITDNCQFKKGKKYISEYDSVFTFSHIGEDGGKYFKDEGQDYYYKKESEYNCIGFGTTDFYEAIETHELEIVLINGKEYLTEEALLQRLKEKGFGLYKVEEIELLHTKLDKYKECHENFTIDQKIKELQELAESKGHSVSVMFERNNN